jgi:predicted nuclease of restriction endonuclease-like RecB superfamily
LAQAVLQRSAAVEISAHENIRAVVRQARLRGLICTVRPETGSSRARLSISGPFALFRHTLVYGRALGGLVPLLARCPDFSLSAVAVLRGERATFRLAAGDPIFPAAAEPRRYDSRLEERFARDVARLAPDWDVMREPEAVEAGGKLLFPDFLLRHRLDPTRRWLVEIVGFWTPDYVSRKLAALRAARISNLVLCIDEERRCSEEDLPPQTPVVRFRRRIDAGEVLAILEANL